MCSRNGCPNNEQFSGLEYSNMQIRPTLMLTRPLPPQPAARAEAMFTIQRWNGHAETLAAALHGAHAVLCNPSDAIDAAMIAAMPASVRVIGTFSVGHEHIDLQAAAARGIAVVNTPGVLSAATAEFTMMLILAAARRAGQGERLLRAGQWGGFSAASLLGTEVSGKHLGIFGMGRIGQVLARMAAGFDMPVHYRNRRPVPGMPLATHHENDAAFLAASDILAICAPATPETRLWLNAGRLVLLPRGAVVVNTARGSLVDDAALIAALQSGQVGAAGLDVFTDEPRVHPGYLALENVVLTPHIASATTETRAAMGHLVLDGIAAVLAGARPPNLVHAA
jgi:lactate dehydrogenase-like 2-hydroxyacid dehydrogenase